MQWKQLCPQNLMVTVSHKSELAVSYYARAVDNTALVALSSLAAEQTTAMTSTQQQVTDLLDFLATNLNATIQFQASNMILNIHSDVSYLSERHAESRTGGIFFLEDLPEDRNPMTLNGAFHVHGTS